MSTPQMTSFGCKLMIAATVLTVGVGGCSWIESITSAPEPEPVIQAPAPPPEPAMAVAADVHLTLFGELPDRNRVPFQSRPAAPMQQHSFTSEGADFDLDVSPDGQSIIFSSTRHTTQPDLYLKTIDGRAVAQLTSDAAADIQPCFSPDGKQVAFASYRAGNWDLWLVSLEGGRAMQVTRSPMHEVHPSFAPDGQRLAYCAFNERAGQWELWTLQLGQFGSKRMIGVGLFPEWSPTSDSIVYQRARERGGRWFSIWRADLELGEPKFPVELAASSQMALIQPSWSPDGAWVTYGTARLAEAGRLADESAVTLTQGDIWIMRADGSSPRQLTQGGGAHFGPIWSSDGRVYFTGLQSGAENIWSVRAFAPPGGQMPVALDSSTGNAGSIDASNGDGRGRRGG